MHTAVLMATRVSYTVNSLLNKIFTYVFAKRKMFTLWHVALHEGGKQALDSLHCFYFLYKLPTLLKVGFVQLAGPQKQSPIDYLIMTGWMPSQRCPTYCANLLNYHDLDGVCLSGNKTITYFLTYFWSWLQRWKNSNKKQSLPSTEKMRVLVKCQYSDSFTRFRRRRSVLIVLTSAVNMCSTVKDSAKHSHCITTKFDYYNYHAKKNCSTSDVMTNGSDIRHCPALMLGFSFQCQTQNLQTNDVFRSYLWNNLPLHLRDFELSLSEFCRLLKTHLFGWRSRRLVTYF